MAKQIDFENDNIAKNMLQTAFPMLIAQTLNLLYSIVDRVYIGKIPNMGANALGAVGLCFPIIIIITAFANMFGVGGAPIFAMRRGNKEKDKASAIMNTSFRLIIVSAVIITVLGEILSKPMLMLFGATTETLGYSLWYLRIYFIGTIFSMIATGMNPYINAQGFPRIGMMSVVIGAIANLILDPIFIFVFGLGINGAAIATVIAQILSAIFVLYYIAGDKLEYKIYFKKEDSLKAYFPYTWDIVSLGFAPFVMNCTNSAVQIASNSMLLKFGGDIYVSIMTILSSVRQITETPVFAICEGTSPIISYNYGAKNAKNVKKAIKLMTIITIIYTAITWLLVEKNSRFLISIFNSDEQLLKKAMPAIHIYFFAYVFQALQYCGQGVFKALNKKKQTIFFSIFRKLILVVPLTFLLPYIGDLGINGIFMAEPISNLVGGIACFTTMVFVIFPEIKGLSNEHDCSI